MERMLYDIRKDAMEKLKTASEEDGILLLDAMGRLKVLFDAAKQEGILSLSSVFMSKKLSYLKMLVLLVEDGTNLESVVEIGTNEYWVQNPQGMEAFLYYVYLRGMLCIQEGINLISIEILFRSLVPKKWRVMYYKRFGNKLDDTLRYRKTEESFFNLYPVLETEELIQKNVVLQAKVKEVDDYSLWHILLEWEPHNDALIKCLYGFNQETRGKIINCLGKTYGRLLMEDTVYLVKMGIKEADVLEAVNEMDYIIEKAINK